MRKYVLQNLKRELYNKKLIKEYIESSEGRRDMMYECSEGYNTFGVGHNMDIKQDQELIDLVFEYDYKKIIKRLNMPQQFPFKFKKQPMPVRKVLCDMAFQMGIMGLKRFKNMLKAISESDYIKASEELLDSKYAKQTPNRAKRNAKILKNCAKKHLK